MALFLGAGRLVLNGSGQQISDCLFTGTALQLLGFAGTVHRIEGHVDVSGVAHDLSDIRGDVTLDDAAVVRLRNVVGSVTAEDEAAALDIECEGPVHLTGGGAGASVKVRCRTGDTGLELVNWAEVEADVQISLAGEHGVRIEACSDVTVEGSVRGSGQSTTGDNVHITGESDQVRVTGLRSRGDSSARAGVFIDTGSEDCIVDGVDFGAAADYGTDDLVDNGTNTRIGTNWSL